MFEAHIKDDIIEDLETLEDWLSEVPNDEDAKRLEGFKLTLESILEEIDR